MKNNLITTKKEEEDKKDLEAMLTFFGQFYDGEDFENIKKEILDSGIGFDGFQQLIENNFLELAIKRQILDTPIQLLTDTAKIPTYSHASDACADIYSDEDVEIAPGETHLISTGIALAIPEGFYCHVYARSGLSSKTSFRLANSVGIIDSGYRGELKVPCWNCGNEPLKIEKGMRIAQIDITPSPAMEFIQVDNVKEIGEDRNGGFGSSGLFEIQNNDLNG